MLSIQLDPKQDNSNINDFQIVHYSMSTHEGRYTHNFQSYGPEKITKCKVYTFLDEEAYQQFDKYYVETLNKTLPGKGSNDKEYDDYHKAMVKFKRTFVREILTYLGYDANVKFTFNQKAGCNCGCSPAFIVDVYTSFDININITYANERILLKNNEEWDALCKAKRLEKSTYQQTLF